MPKCQSCERNSVAHVPDGPTGFVCVSHAEEFWQAVVGEVKRRTMDAQPEAQEEAYVELLEMAQAQAALEGGRPKTVHTEYLPYTLPCVVTPGTDTPVNAGVVA